MDRIETLIAQSSAALKDAAAAADLDARDRAIMRSERLLDEAWRLNEADASRPPFESGLWCTHMH